MTEQGAPEAAAVSIDITDDERNLAVSFLQLLRSKIADIPNLDTNYLIIADEMARATEGFFGIQDAHYAFEPTEPLIDMFVKAESADKEARGSRSADDINAEAESLKEKGNGSLQAGNFEEALSHYNQAIRLAPKPVYFCNRAAAYCRVEQYERAIHDCRVAIGLDDKYGKAYGRLGLALSCQHQYPAAIEAYKKAIELEPEVQSYKSNLDLAEANFKKSKDVHQTQGGAPNLQDMFGSLGGMFGGATGAGGMPDLSNMASIMQSPEFAAMANNFLADPAAISMAQNMFGPLMGGGANPAAGPPPNFADLASQFRDHIRESNPDIIENLRNNFGGPAPPGGNPPGPNEPGN
uniref:TPR_REGION domain-containing protein n=1 Tax=Rhabditophanes sp. KR3021 TaxID=114890 RepID=A0AC35UFV5_9BILA